jgi:ABC-type glycerol-3-phosphate transport system substrate-binding protein
VIIPPALQIPTDADPRDGNIKPERIPEGMFPLIKNKATLRIAIPNNAAVEDFNTNAFTKWYEEKTNVHVEWIILPSGPEGLQKLNLMISSGDLPEVIMGYAFNITAAQMEVYGKQGIFIPLNDLIDKYGVNVQNAFAQYPLAKEVATSPTGEIYGLPEINDCFHCLVAQKLWIYQPWLDKLGLKMPTTTDEYEQVLKAFKEKDPNGNGQADEIPLSSDVGGWNSAYDLYFMNSFLFNPGTHLVLNNGKVEITYNKPEWREGLRYLNKLYKEGLIDPSSLTQDNAALQRTGQADPPILGSAPWGYPGGWAPIVNEKGARWNEYVVVPPLTGPAGFRTQAANPYNTVGIGRYIITKAAKNPALALRWGDAFYQQEVEIAGYLGPEGIGWEWAKEGQKGINGKQALYVALKTWGNTQNDQWSQTNPSFRSSDFRLGQMSDNPYELETVLYRESNKLMPFAQDPKLSVPPLYFSTDDAQEIAELEAALKKYVDEMTARFINGDANIDGDDWDTYVQTLNQTGLTRYMEIQQKTYDVKYKK